MNMTFKDIFDVSKLSEHEIGAIEYVLNSPCYASVFRPFLLRSRESAIRLVLDPHAEKMKQYDEKDMKWKANVIEELVTFFDHIIEETQHERAVRAAQYWRGDTQEEQYTKFREEGKIGPAGQTVLIDGYPADEEF